LYTNECGGTHTIICILMQWELQIIILSKKNTSPAESTRHHPRDSIRRAGLAHASHAMQLWGSN